MNITTEQLVAEAGQMALELRLKDRVIAGLEARVAGLEARVAELEQQAASEEKQGSRK